MSTTHRNREPDEKATALTEHNNEATLDDPHCRQRQAALEREGWAHPLLAKFAAAGRGGNEADRLLDLAKLEPFENAPLDVRVAWNELMAEAWDAVAVMEGKPGGISVSAAESHRRTAKALLEQTTD